MTVITGVPNFPMGKIYDGYKNSLWKKETMDGIAVIRVWTYITANEGFSRRILDYVSYMVSATIAALFVKGVDVVIGTSPQFFTVCAAYMASRLKRTQFVFELRDMWPESIKAVGAMKDSAIVRFLEKVEMFLYQKAARIVSVTNSFKNKLVERGVDGAKIDVITNGVDISRFKPRERDAGLAKRFGLEGKFVAGYIGTHGMAHALETLLNAAKKIGEKERGKDLRFILLGNGARKEDLVRKAREMMLDNVIFLDSVPKEEVVRYWSLLDVSIIHLKKTPLFRTVIPSKLFECMGMGIPVLHGVAGESAEIVEKEKAGLVFEPENDNELVDKLLKLKEDTDLYEQLKANCVAAALKYDRAVLAGKMLEILQQVKGTRN